MEDAVYTGSIQWEGLFNSGKMSSQYRVATENLLHFFLEEANLLWSNATAVAFEMTGGNARQSIRIDRTFDHEEFVDLILTPPEKSRGVKVRLMWNCGRIFPAEMGIPTAKRLRQAAKEFNETGTVTTKVDNSLTTIPAYAAGMVLGVAAIMSDYRHRRS